MMSIAQMDGVYFNRELAIYHPINNEIMQIDHEELIHFKSVIATFYNYMHDMKFEVKRIQTHFANLSEKHKKLLLMNPEERILKLQFAIQCNAEFCFMIVAAYIDIFPSMDLTKVQYVCDMPYFHNGEQSDISKLRITLKQFYRDWSKEAQFERDQCYKPIITRLMQYFPKSMNIKVLLPGAGLGRLVYELAILGFSAQGNEFSYFMLLGSHFILNMTQTKEQFEIQPFANNFCNRLKESDPFESVRIPDVLPSQHIQQHHEMSFVAGEFMAVYRQPSQFQTWDSIITCFFIDTANNIIEYIETIYELLKPKGVWINFGPLEYHYANQFAEQSIELSWEDLRHIIKGVGFTIEHEEMKESTYNNTKLDIKSMVYNCVFMSAVKQ